MLFCCCFGHPELWPVSDDAQTTLDLQVGLVRPFLDFKKKTIHTSTSTRSTASQPAAAMVEAGIGVGDDPSSRRKGPFTLSKYSLGHLHQALAGLAKGVLFGVHI
jgi:hypothetical protein